MRAESGEQDDDFIEEDEVDAPAATAQKLRDRLRKAIAEKQEYLDGWQRARADFANYKKDEEQRFTNQDSRIKAKLVEALLPTLDTLELSQKHSPDQILKMLEGQFLSSLKQMGVERFGRDGDDFDPHAYEAIDQHTVLEEEKDNTVLSVRRSGYRTGEQVIRPAQVVVSVYKK
ncbi:MAG: nucleotide exchange factor GrpE [Minisyncoccia bacterium]